MVTQAQIKLFIDKIAPILQKEAKARGYKVVSPAISQALQESLSSKSASGISQLAEKYHNYHGMKCGQYWLSQKKPSVSLKTGEEYKPGVITQITDYFRVFPDMESGLKGYYDFLNMKRYAAVKSAATPEAYMNAIKSDGYCTSTTYIKNCLDKIDKYNLTQYDNFLTGQIVTGQISTVKRATVKKGSRGTDVTYLQQRLTAKGYGVGNIDGIFGIKTLEAVKAFQAENGLTVDGIVGSKTWSAIE